MLTDLAQRIFDGKAARIDLICIKPVGNGSDGLVEDIALVRFGHPADHHGILAAPCLGADQMLAHKRQFKAEYGFAALNGKKRTVHIKRYLRLIGVHFDLGLVFASVEEALAAEMDERFPLVPGGFVKVECVLAQLPVKGHKTLLVLAVLSALVTSVSGEIKEVPHMGRPEVRPFFYHPKHVLVIQRLVFLGIVPLLGTRRMIGGIGVRAVLGKADDAVGVFGMVLVKELVRLRKLAQIPAEIEIVAVDIRDLQDGAVDLQHEDVRHGGKARRVHAVAEVVE